MSNLLEKASLVLIPSGYKEDIVYSEIPIDGSADMVFTRSSNGTRINSAGLVEVCPWNLQTYSEDFSNASWAKNNSPVMSYNVATAPNGTMTADSIQSNTASFYQSVSAPSLSIAPNSTVTLSIYIKKETSKTYFGGTFLYFTGGTTKLTYVLFDEVNGTINIVAPDQVSMVTSVESVGDWWRFIVTGTDTGSNTQLDFSFYGTLSQNGTSLSPGIGSARTIWGAQLNIGSTAKPYFPTTDRLNVPRLTYQNGGGGCPSLLLEKQSTNLALYSQQFDDGAWSKSGVTVTANNTTSPDGTQNAEKIEASGSGSISHSVRSFITTTSGSVYAFSLYAKKGTTDWIMLRHDNGGSFNFFNLNTGTKGTTSQASSTIESVGNGWYRLTVFHTGTGSNGPEIYIATADGTNEFTANGQTLYIWGAQYEASSYPTSYIPTTSSSATRVADACFKTGISSLIGQTSGSVFFDFTVDSVTQPSDPVLWYMKDGGAGERYVELYSNGNLVYAEIDAGGPVAAITKSGLTVGRHKCAIAYATNDFVFYVDGVQVGTDTSGTPSGFSTFGLQYYLSTYTGSQKVNQCAIFKTRLTNAELASLTTI